MIKNISSNVVSAVQMYLKKHGLFRVLNSSSLHVPFQKVLIWLWYHTSFLQSFHWHLSSIFIICTDRQTSTSSTWEWKTKRCMGRRLERDKEKMSIKQNCFQTYSQSISVHLIIFYNTCQCRDTINCSLLSYLSWFGAHTFWWTHPRVFTWRESVK